MYLLIYRNDLAAEKRSVRQWCLHTLETTTMIQRCGIIVMRVMLDVSKFILYSPVLIYSVFTTHVYSLFITHVYSVFTTHVLFGVHCLCFILYSTPMFYCTSTSHVLPCFHHSFYCVYYSFYFVFTLCFLL